jgi:hypothetical protein
MCRNTHSSFLFWQKEILIPVIVQLNQIYCFHFRMLLVLRGGKLKCLISPLLTERQLLGYLGIGRYEPNSHQSTSEF